MINLSKGGRMSIAKDLRQMENELAAEAALIRKCGRKSAHDPHPYSYIDLRGRDISFGQTFNCPGIIARKLTANEAHVLGAIASGQATWLQYIHTGDRSPQGCHQTAASLVRKGMVVRVKTAKGMFYKTTPRARDVLRNT
jgi:hypothetical protein